MQWANATISNPNFADSDSKMTIYQNCVTISNGLLRRILSLIISKSSPLRAPQRGWKEKKNQKMYKEAEKDIVM